MIFLNPGPSSSVFESREADLYFDFALNQVLALCPKGDYCHDNAPLELEEEDLILTTEVIYLRA